MTSWSDLIELRVEAAVDRTVEAGVWNQALWGNDLWSSGSGTAVWADLECELLTVSIQRGSRARLSDNVSTGTASIVVDNRSGWATGAPGTALTLRPGRPIRVRYRIPNSAPQPQWTDLWVGTVQSVTTQHSPEDGMVTTTINAIDCLATLALVDPPETAVGNQALTNRIRTIIDLAEATGMDYSMVGERAYWQLQSGTIAQSLLTEAQLAANSANSVVYAATVPDSIVVEPMYLVPTAAELAFLDNWPVKITNVAPSVGYANLCPLDVTFSGPDVDGVANLVQMARTGGTLRTKEDTASQALYGLRTWGRQDLALMFDDASQSVGGGSVDEVAAEQVAYRSRTYPTVEATVDLPNSLLPETPSTPNYPKQLALLFQAILGGTFYCLVDWSFEGAWASTGIALGIGVTHRIGPETWTMNLTVDVPATVGALSGPTPRPLEVAAHG